MATDFEASFSSGKQDMNDKINVNQSPQMALFHENPSYPSELDDYQDAVSSQIKFQVVMQKKG